VLEAIAVVPVGVPMFSEKNVVCPQPFINTKEKNNRNATRNFKTVKCRRLLTVEITIEIMFAFNKGRQKKTIGLEKRTFPQLNICVLKVMNKTLSADDSLQLRKRSF
jgi:hypothetical protein